MQKRAAARFRCRNQKPQLRRRATQPTAPNPANISPKVVGSGTKVTVSSPEYRAWAVLGVPLINTEKDAFELPVRPAKEITPKLVTGAALPFTLAVRPAMFCALSVKM